MTGTRACRVAVLRITFGISLTLGACVQSSSPTNLPSITRVASVDTATPSPLPPAATARLTSAITPPLTAAPARTPSALKPTVTAPPVVRFMAIGDVMLARTIGDRISNEGPTVPFARLATVLEDAELLAANLECVIGGGGEPAPKAYTFRAPAAAADALAFAGVDVVSLANNHALDYGIEGLMGMLQRLGERDISVVGAGAGESAAREAVILTRNGLRVAFLAYVDVPVESRTGFDTRSWIASAGTPGVAWADLDHISADVASARTRADVVVVMFHFGLEGRAQITAAQRAQARAAIDAGAALVLGTHPHVLQPTELYHGGFIAYSLGNFVFDGFTLPENYSAIFTAMLTREGVKEYAWIPIVIEDGLPRLAAPDEAPVVLARVRPF